MNLRLSLALAALFAFAAAPSSSHARTPKNVATLPRPVTVDGDLSDLKAATVVKGPEDAFQAWVGFRQNVLYLGVEISPEHTPQGTVMAEVTVHFENAGPLARGHVWRLGPAGLLPPTANLPAHAHRLTEAAVDPGEDALRMELAVPVRALPRFPARDALVMDVCIQVGALTNCTGASMGDPLRLPDFRKTNKVKPPEEVDAVEGREDSWLGFAHLHYPVWVVADGPITVPSLREKVAEGRLVQADKVGVTLPDALQLPDKRTILSVLTGTNPYATAGECNSDHELRFALYLVQKNTATRVLEWPAATCALGRAVSFELEEDGELAIGYTNGATVTFQWFKDHFERTEIGSR